MRRLWFKILLLLPIPVLVVGFNWFVDPMHLRTVDQYESGIARLILEGKHVTKVSVPDLRDGIFMQLFVDGLRTRKDVLVFGSSRSKLIRSDSFPGVTMFNNSLDGARLTDYLAIYQMYRQKGLAPSIAVIEANPWILGHYNSYWKAFDSQQPALEAQVLSPQPVRHIQFNNTAPVKVSDLLSPGNFQVALLLGRKSTDKIKYCPWNGQALPQGHTIMADGSTLNPIPMPWNRDRVLTLAVYGGNNPLGIPDALDPNAKKIFDAFLDELRSDGVQPVLFIPPYHPQAYALMIGSERNKIIVEEQEYFEDSAKRRALTVVGSYNPADMGLVETDFLDSSHCTAEAIRNLFNSRISVVLDRVKHAADIAPHLELIGIDNVNGLETDVNGALFFWMSNNESAINLLCTKTGVALLSFNAYAGVSLPENNERFILLRTDTGFSRLLQFDRAQRLQIPFPVRPGFNRVFLTPLDKPTANSLPNGDLRVLMVGVTGLSVKLAPAGTAIPKTDPLALRLATGWYGVERSGDDWWSWSAGHGQIRVLSATASRAILTGTLDSASHPNSVDVFVNGSKVDTWSIEEGKTTVIPTVPLSLNVGENIIELISQKSAIATSSDKRSLAIMGKNLGIQKTNRE